MSTPSPDSSQTIRRRHLAQAAGVVALAFVLSRLFGLAREMLISAYFGVDSTEAVAFALANRIPDLIFNVLAGGALGSAFIPTFSGYFARQDTAGAWRLFSAVINLTTLALTVLCALTALLASPLVTTFFLSAADLQADPDVLPLTITLMRIMLLSPIIFGVSGVFMGALNARQHFLLPSLAASVYNIGIIIGTWLFAPNILGVAYGAVLGAAGHALIQWPALRQQGAKYEWVLTVREEGIQQVLRLMAPRVLGLSFSYLNPTLMAIITQGLPLGTIVALDRAFVLMRMPYSILGQALGVATFPTLAALAAQEKWDEIRHILTTALRSILFLGFPAVAVLLTLSYPFTAILFEYGAFDSQATLWVSWALFFYAFALLALAALEVVSRTFYALGDTLTPVVAGMVQLPLMAGLGVVLAYGVFPAVGLLELGGIALAFTLSNCLEVVVLLWLLRRRLGGLDGRELWDGTWRMGTAALLMAVGMGVTAWLTAPAGVWVEMAAGAAVGGVLYPLGCWLLQVPEFNQLVAYGRQRLNI